MMEWWNNGIMAQIFFQHPSRSMRSEFTPRENLPICLKGFCVNFSSFSNIPIIQYSNIPFREPFDCAQGPERFTGVEGRSELSPTYSYICQYTHMFTVLLHFHRFYFYCFAMPAYSFGFPPEGKAGADFSLRINFLLF